MAILPKSLTNKTVVITGANSGIGKVTAKICIELGAKVFMLCRDIEKAIMVLEEIKNELDISKDSNLIQVEQLDLSSLKSVRKCAECINKQTTKIDYLINNAGIMTCPENRTEDGIESQFATNYLGHFLLTNLLLDKIKASPSARIINVSSIAHIGGRIHFDNINLEGKYTPLKSYKQSKLANILFTVELAKRLRKTNVKVFALHPGLVYTDLKRYLNNISQFILSSLHKLILISPVLGAQTTLYCAFQEGIEDQSGQYFVNCRRKKTLSYAMDEKDAQRLWEISCALCKIKNIEE